MHDYYQSAVSATQSKDDWSWNTNGNFWFVFVFYGPSTAGYSQVVQINFGK